VGFSGGFLKWVHPPPKKNGMYPGLWTLVIALAQTQLPRCNQRSRCVQIQSQLKQSPHIGLSAYYNCDSTRQSGHHDSMLMKAWIHTRRHFTWEVDERAIPTLTIEGCYPMLIRQCECHSYYRDVHYYVIICPVRCLLHWMRHLSTRRKKWTCSFFIVVKSKSNRNCNSHFRRGGSGRLVLTLSPCMVYRPRRGRHGIYYLVMPTCIVSAVCFILLVCCWQREDDRWQTQSWDCDALLRKMCEVECIDVKQEPVSNVFINDQFVMSTEWI